jgi:hypothetical protein
MTEARNGMQRYHSETLLASEHIFNVGTFSPISQPPGIPKSSYHTGPPGMGSVFGTDAGGEIGIHHPREIICIGRDYSAGELPQ